MGSLTNFAEMELLDHICLTSYTPASNVYVALCTADPTDAATGGSMNECANSNNYARAAVTFGAAASRMISNSGAVTFNQATGGGWGTVSHWAIVTSNTYGSGDVLAYGAFSASKVVNEGNTPSIADGEIDISFNANELSNYAANGALDFMFRNQSFTVSANHVALCTATIADGDTGSSITEPGSGAYARKQVNANGGAAPDWDVAVSGDPSYVDNNDEIAFPTATGDWGTIVAVALCDASTAGNLLFYDNDMTDQAVNNGDTAKFPAGDLDWQMS